MSEIRPCKCYYFATGAGGHSSAVPSNSRQRGKAIKKRNAFHFSADNSRIAQESSEERNKERIDGSVWSHFTLFVRPKVLFFLPRDPRRISNPNSLPLVPRSTKREREREREEKQSCGIECSSILSLIVPWHHYSTANTHQVMEK